VVTNLPNDAPVAVCGMWVVNEQTVYIAGANTPETPVRMMKTVDGGRTWTAWDMRQWADNLIDVYFPTVDRGWVVGGRTDDRNPNPAKPMLRPVVLYTQDGGRTFTDQVASIRNQMKLGEWGWKMQFLDDQIGFVALQNYEDGAILTTTDGGASWTRRPVNDPQKNQNLEGIGFIDEKHGWVGGWGDRAKMKQTTSETLDGGLTWRDANEIGKTINRFRFFGKPVQFGFAAGKTVYKYAPGPTPPLPPALEKGRLLDDLEPLTAVGMANVRITVPPGAARLTVRIWDSDGPLVRKLIDESNPAPGPRVLTWDRTNDAGQSLPAHSYIWRVTVDQTSESKLVLVQPPQ
jgi:FlgD Ig-like domain